MDVAPNITRKRDIENSRCILNEQRKEVHPPAKVSQILDHSQVRQKTAPESQRFTQILQSKLKIPQNNKRIELAG